MLNGKLMMKEHKVKRSKRPMGQNVEWEIMKNGNNVECYTVLLKCRMGHNIKQYIMTNGNDVESDKQKNWEIMQKF